MQFDTNKRRVCPSCGDICRQFGVILCPKFNVPYEDECIFSKPEEFQQASGKPLQLRGHGVNVSKYGDKKK